MARTQFLAIVSFLSSMFVFIGPPPSLFHTHTPAQDSMATCSVHAVSLSLSLSFFPSLFPLLFSLSLPHLSLSLSPLHVLMLILSTLSFTVTCILITLSQQGVVPRLKFNTSLWSSLKNRSAIIVKLLCDIIIKVTSIYKLGGLSIM